ncbi:MAG: iron complex transport system permease protein [Methanohalophilus sp. T328-1]|nr:MAG: iron complex transport system permease protein [Methanohalophilus sp. T328-1]
MGTVIFQIRLPRIIAAMLVGAGLSISGASFQGLFRNPLVSPYILGVASGAGFGACLGILIGKNIFVIQPKFDSIHSLLKIPSPLST